MHVFLLIRTAGFGGELRGFDDGDGAVERYVIWQPFKPGFPDIEVNGIR